MSTRGKDVARSVSESLGETRRERRKGRRRQSGPSPDFPPHEESCLHGVFAWLAKCGSSSTGYQLNQAFLFGRPIRDCDRCQGTGLVSSAEESMELPGLESALGDRQCERCDGSGVVSQSMYQPLPEWYREPSPECPEGIRNCAGAPPWSEEIKTKSGHATEAEYREPDPSAYAWIGRQLARLLRVAQVHGTVTVAVLQAWYGTEGRRYDPEEVPISRDDALRTLRQAIVDGNLELEVPQRPQGYLSGAELIQEDQEVELLNRLRAFNDEFGARKKAEIGNRHILPFSEKSLEIGAILLPKRRIRAEYLGRLARLEMLWPATKLGRRELDGCDGTGMREHVSTRKGGHCIVAQLDREAEKLLKKAQQAWLEPEETETATASVEFDENWQDAWKEVQGAWLNKASVKSDSSENLDELWHSAWEVIQCAIAGRLEQR